MASSVIFRSFSAGELSPALAARADLAIYAAGLRTCRNFLIGRHGGALNRPGTTFVHACKTDSADVRLVRYVHETPGESVLLELGVNYLRFYLNGTLVSIEPSDFPAYDNGAEYTPGRVVVSAGLYYVATATTTGNLPTDPDFWTELTALDDNGWVIYELPTPFDFPRETKWVQSGRVITFTHQSVRPRDLTYIASDEWRFEEVETTGVAIPQNPVVTQPPHTVDITYEVRAVDFVAGAGPLSTAFIGTFSPPTTDSPINLTWDDPISGPPDAFEIYRNGFLIGSTSSNDFADTGQPAGDPWSPGTGGGTVDEPLNLDADQPTVVLDTQTYRYIVTAIVGGEESLASDVASDDLISPTLESHNVAWDAVAGATSYNVYADPNGNGIYGFIGSSATNAFGYNGTPAPDFAHNPPTDSGFFSGSDFPACAGYYQQRRIFGNTPADPDRVRASRTGLPNNFTISTPLEDSDALDFRLLGREQHAVREILGLNDLVILTDGGEWRSRSAPGEPLTPSNLPFNQDTYVGAAANVRACVIGNTLVYVQARGRKVVEAKFAQQVESLANRDLTIAASHLFDAQTLVAMDYQYEAHSIVWVCRADGALLGVTYIEGADVVGWHRHDTAGAFEDVCVIPERNEDTVYVIVSREIDGDTVRYIERLADRTAALVFADAAVVYNGAPIASLTGLDHLEGETVAVVAGGQVLTPKTVAGGAIALGANYSAVVAGLAIEADLETLDLDVLSSDVRARKKRVQSIGLLLDRSAKNFLSGPSTDKLKRVPNASNAATFTGLFDMALTSAFDDRGRVFIRHDQPTPLTVLGLIPYVEVGG